MAGITRIQIVSEGKPRDWRFNLPEAIAPYANSVYREMFSSVSMPLASGDTIEKVSHDDLKGRYDWQEGIDILLQFEDGTKGTMQEKLMFTTWSTATFEEKKTSGVPGAWYTCTAQYYACLYTVETRAVLLATMGKPNFAATIREGVIYNLPRVHQCSQAGQIGWNPGHNDKDGRRSTFRYFLMKQSPVQSVVASYKVKTPEGAQFDQAPPVQRAITIPVQRQMTLEPELHQMILPEATHQASEGKDDLLDELVKMGKEWRKP